VLELRPLGPEHVDGLDALYNGLSDDDRHRRFFSSFRPSRAFLDRWSRLSERGGGGLVAIVTEPATGGEQLVAEAGFAPLPDGNAELALTVAAEWRGWLGSYLLDALVEQAAAAGIRTLEAEVLVANGPMLGLLRGRGAAIAGHPDWTTLRLIVGTGPRVPDWPATHPRPRLLVEGAGSRWAGEEAAIAAGYDVVTCPGPGRRRGRCPVLAGGSCSRVDGADAVRVVVRNEPEPLGAALRDGLNRGATPPVVVDWQPPAVGPTDVKAGIAVFRGCTPSAALVAALDEARNRAEARSGDEDRAEPPLHPASVQPPSNPPEQTCA
jgi:RimJ/RimL family protein N-acetyltransferase